MSILTNKNKRLILLLLLMIMKVGMAIPSASSISLSKKLLLAVTINKKDNYPVILCLKDTSQLYWISEPDILSLGLTLPSHETWHYHGKRYYQLAWFKDTQYQVNEQDLTLHMQIASQYFSTTVIRDQRLMVPAIRPDKFGLYMNYDATAQRNTFVRQNDFSAITEFGLFNYFGVGTNAMLLQQGNTSNKMVRLETAWIQDQPENMATWRWGDAITSAASWSGAARFGGIQYATNFSTQPNLITFPQPNFKGEAVLPSNISLFVNNVLQQNTSVNPGPYTITNVPVVTGAGTMSVIMQDLLGRQQTIILPYYASPQLLKAGLSQFSYETGFIRNNFAIQSNNYSHFLLSGTHQLGITDTLTSGWHGEILKEQQTIGWSLAQLLSQYGVLSAAIAGSQQQQGTGILISAGFNRQTQKNGFGFQSTLTSPHFTQIGYLPSQQSPSLTLQIFAGINFDEYGSLSSSYTMVKSRSFQLPTANILTIAYNRDLLKNVYLNIGVIDNFNQHHNDQLFASLVFVLDPIHTLNVNSNVQSGQSGNAVQFTKNLPWGTGDGYHLYAANQAINQIEGDYTYQNNYGTFTGKAARVNQQNNLELDASGSIVHFGNKTRFARRLINSFALVEVPHLKDINVYYRNALIGTTDGTGSLFIPDLLPYQINDIHIDTNQLPLTSTIDEPHQAVIPYYRSGVHVIFPIKKNQGILFHLMDTTGKPLPAGAIVKLASKHNQETYPVAYDGTVYIDSYIGKELSGNAYWRDSQCHFNFTIPTQMKVITQIGQVSCH